MRAAGILCLTVALAGCGGSNAGGGTRTLYVLAIAESDGSTAGTRLGVEVREGGSTGNVITDAVVMLRGDKTGEATLPWQGVRWGGFTVGSYYREGGIWDSHLVVDVRRGSDRLDGALEMPGYTTITEPIAETTFRRSDGSPLMIRWKDSFDRRAQIVKVRVEKADHEQTLAEDPGRLQVEPNRLIPEGAERVRVDRTNQIELAGGTPGSLFRATTEHRIGLKVE